MRNVLIGMFTVALAVGCGTGDNRPTNNEGQPTETLGGIKNPPTEGVESNQQALISSCTTGSQPSYLQLHVHTGANETGTCKKFTCNSWPGYDYYSYVGNDLNDVIRTIRQDYHTYAWYYQHANYGGTVQFLSDWPDAPGSYMSSTVPLNNGISSIICSGHSAN